MTRKEAIIRIKDHMDIHRMYEPKGTKISEALDMAIKALEQPEPCEDAVSRQAAIDILDDYQVMVENGEEKPYAWARLRMSELPSAQPEPDWTEIMVVCDNCGHIIHVKRVNVLPLGRAEGR